MEPVPPALVPGHAARHGLLGVRVRHGDREQQRGDHEDHVCEEAEVEAAAESDVRVGEGALQREERAPRRVRAAGPVLQADGAVQLPADERRVRGEEERRRAEQEGEFPGRPRERDVVAADGQRDGHQVEAQRVRQARQVAERAQVQRRGSRVARELAEPHAHEEPAPSIELAELDEKKSDPDGDDEAAGDDAVDQAALPRARLAVDVASLRSMHAHGRHCFQRSRAAIVRAGLLPSTRTSSWPKKT